MTIDRSLLTRQHAGLVESAAELRKVIASNPPDIQRLTKVRWQLRHRLAVHFAQEDKFVYPALKMHANPRVARLSSLYAREMGDLDQAFRAYLDRWPLEEILCEWAAFTRETRSVLGLLANRIAREEQELYPMLG